MNLVGIAALIAATAFLILVSALVPSLIELKKTLADYRSLQPSVRELLDHTRRTSSNVEELSRQLTVQSARVDRITERASGVVEGVGETVELYNRLLVRPAIWLSAVSSGLSRGRDKFFGRRKDKR